MEASITSQLEFIQRYWKYYSILEQEFLSVERYVAIDKINFASFSNEYIKQYQTICSEIDVIAKSYCRELSGNSKSKTIDAYCKCIIDNYTDFSSRIIKLIERNLQVVPWDSWSYSTSVKNGKTSINANNPDWWQKYNRIKHNRTTINNNTGLPYFKLANQKNVLYSLAGLFQLEMYYFRFLHDKYFPSDPDMPIPSSNLFEIEGWSKSWITAGNLAFQISP